MNKINKWLEKLNPQFAQFLPYIEQSIKELDLKFSTESSLNLFSHKNTFLIAYADQFYSEHSSPLQLLNQFLEKDLEGEVSHVHILPFYPSTSDDGFAPRTYKKVDEGNGTWSDIEQIKSIKMFDCVFNHMSSQNEFFQKALHGDPHCQKMFHIYSEKEYLKPDFQENIKMVVRPRTTPLFSVYFFKDGHKYVWTTFSKDQVDTNLENPDMFKYVLETFFLYVEKGARFFRVDAVPFLWKELGTNSSHHEKTHIFVKLFRAIMDEFKLNLTLITESNVPHQENITYLGSGEDEAHVVYNFSLAPLLLHGITFETNKFFNRWASDIFKIHTGSTYLNFTATHDGIGLRGLEGLVPEEDIQQMGQLALDKGGQVGMKRSRDGSLKPYELNVTWASFLENTLLSPKDNIKKVVNSHGLVMFFPGIAAHYAHNFLYSKNWQEGFKESSIPRRLNRKRLPYPLIHSEESKACLKGLLKLTKFKNQHPCFGTQTPLKIVDIKKEVLSFKRIHQEETLLVLFNLTEKPQPLEGDGFSYNLAPFELVFFREGKKIATF